MWTQRPCGPGTYYSEETGDCRSWPESACARDKITGGIQNPGKPPQTPSVQTVDDLSELCVDGEKKPGPNCSMYFECNHQQFIPRPCGPGVFFSAETLECSSGNPSACKTGVGSQAAPTLSTSPPSAPTISAAPPSAPTLPTSPPGAPTLPTSPPSAPTTRPPAPTPASYQDHLGIHFQSNCSPENTKKPVLGNCKEFLLCNHGNWVEQSCPSGTTFEPTSGTCVHAQDGSCFGDEDSSSSVVIVAGGGASSQNPPNPTQAPPPVISNPATFPIGNIPTPPPDQVIIIDAPFKLGSNAKEGLRTGDSGIAPPSDPDEKVVMCYLTSVSWYRKGFEKFLPENIDPSLCTHLMYAFAMLDPTEFIIKPKDLWTDLENGSLNSAYSYWFYKYALDVRGFIADFYARVTSLKRHGVRVLLSLGGWEDSEGSKYSMLVNSPERRRRFVEHSVDFLTLYGFQGLDLHWQYPKCWHTLAYLGGKDRIHHHRPTSMTFLSMESHIDVFYDAMDVLRESLIATFSDNRIPHELCLSRKGFEKFLPENIDPSLCTHLMYAFAILDPTEFIIKPKDLWTDLENGSLSSAYFYCFYKIQLYALDLRGFIPDFYARVTSLKRHGVRVLLSLGGWEDSEGPKYSMLVNSPERRRKFVKHSVDFLTLYGFQGLDLHWQYPKCWH
ncbi:unnamed protein product, partial [Cyprideis torosa]